MAFALFAQLEKLIDEHGSANILRQHVELLKTQSDILEKERDTLKLRNDQLETENKRLEGRGLVDLVTPDGFKEAYGVLWRPFPGLKQLEYDPYCPRCVMKMRRIKGGHGIAFNCSICNFEISQTYPPPIVEV